MQRAPLLFAGSIWGWLPAAPSPSEWIASARRALPSPAASAEALSSRQNRTIAAGLLVGAAYGQASSTLSLQCPPPASVCSSEVSARPDPSNP